MTVGELIKKIREKKDFSQRQLALYSEVSNTEISKIESGERQNPNPEILKKIAVALGINYIELFQAAGYLDPDTPTPADKISDSVSDDPELAKFWDELKKREDLQLLFKQTRELSPGDIKKVMRIIKAIEDEEAADDSL